MKTALIAMFVLACGAKLPAQQSPAVRRLHEAVAAASSGKAEQMKTFAATAYAPVFRGLAPDEGPASYLTQFAGARIQDSRITVTGNRAAAAVENPVTEEVDSAIVEVDGTAANLITRVIYVAGAGRGVSRTYASDEARAAELRRYVKQLADAD
ncbi:MAG TPA: hypothetical protein VGC44_04855, partial [Longimicrobiales bacterium]